MSGVGCKMKSVEWKVEVESSQWECKVWGGGCKVWSVECEVWSVKSKV